MGVGDAGISLRSSVGVGEAMVGVGDAGFSLGSSDVDRGVILFLRFRFILLLDLLRRSLGSANVDLGVLLLDLLGRSHGLSNVDFGVRGSLVRDGGSESSLSALVSEVTVGIGDADVSLGSSHVDWGMINLVV